MSLPTMILFRDGEPVTTIVGAYPKARIEERLDSVLVL
jgi:thioredoxin 1